MILKTPFLSINGTDVSSSVRSVNLALGVEAQDDTTAGTTRTSEAGLLTTAMSAEFLQNYAVIDALIGPLLLAGTEVAVIVRPDTAAAAAGNPQYTGNFFVSAYDPVAQSIGDTIVASVTLSPVNAIARAVS